MSNFSYGPEPQTRVQQLLECLLDYANDNLDETLTTVNLDARWEDGEELHLAVETTLEDLRVLIYGKEKVAEKVKTAQRKEIGAFLTHYLGEFLEILCDRRVKKRGSPRWIFSLKLWSKDKDQNLQQFQRAWRNRQPENSPTAGAPSFQVEITSSPPTPRSQGIQTLGLETIAEIPVWVGRDVLLEGLKAKLLAPEAPPKVLAMIGQGGIGKTSLAVKLLESLGVQLQPPALTEACPYQKALYLKTYEGTSFDAVAAFLLRGLAIATPEPLKTATEKITTILDGLTKQRSVVVLDNLEDILHPAHHPDCGKALSPEWGELLRAFVYGNHGSTVILTSREFPVDLTDPRARTRKPDPKLVEVLMLSGVEDADGVEILRQRGSEDSEEDWRWMAERVKGNTFVLTQLAAIGAESPGYLRKHPELVTEEAELILEAQLGRQGRGGIELLRRMCVLRVGIDIEGLTFLRLYRDDREEDGRFERAVVSGEPAELTKAEVKETTEIVMGLVNSSLVQRRYDREQCEWYYDLHRLIVEYLQLQYQAELPQLMERVYKFYCTGKTVENPKTLEDLRPVLEAQYFAFLLGNYKEAYSLIKYQLDSYLTRWGYWDLLKDLYEQILPYADEDEKAYCLLSIGVVYRDIGSWNASETYFQNALEISLAQKNRSRIAMLQGFLGDIERNRGNWDEAERLYRQSLALRTELGDREGIAISTGCLGENELGKGNLDVAENYLTEALAQMKELGMTWHIAETNFDLAQLWRKRGNEAIAQQHYQKSHQIYQQLGAIKELERIEQEFN